MKQFWIIASCYAVSVITLTISILDRLIWHDSFWLKLCACVSGLALLVGTSLLFGYRKHS